MKLNKKFLSCLTAVTVAMAPMTAFADTYDIVGDGSVSYLDTEIYNVVLPTSDSIAFTVDPYGVAAGGNGMLDEVLSGAAGTVTSAATAVINKSSVDLDVEIGLLFDHASTTASNSAVTLGTKAEAEAGTADLYLAVQQLVGAELTTYVTDTAATVTIDAVDADGNPTTVTTSAATVSHDGLTLSGTSATLATGTAVTATNAAAVASSEAIEFTLKNVAYAYEVSGNDATLSEAALNYNADNVYAFVIGGYANPYSGAWEKISDANAGLELTMKFNISKSEGVKQVLTTDGTNDIVMKVAETTITSLTVTSANGKSTTKTINGTTYSFENGLLTIAASELNNWRNSSWGTGIYTVTIGSSKYNFTIN